MKPSTVIVAGGVAVAAYLLWRAHSATVKPPAKSCGGTASNTSSTVLGSFIKSRLPLLGCDSRTRAASTVSRPVPLAEDPPIVLTAPTRPAGTTTTGTRIAAPTSGGGIRTSFYSTRSITL